MDKPKHLKFCQKNQSKENYEMRMDEQKKSGRTAAEANRLFHYQRDRITVY